LTTKGPIAGAARETQTLCGARAVLAALRHRPDDLERLFFAADCAPEHSEILRSHLRRAAARRVPYRQAGSDELERICGSRAHQGLVAVFRAPRVHLAGPTQLRSFAAQDKVWVALDCVGNPHNLGAIARTAAFLGAAGLLVERGQASAHASAAAYRTAEGALESLPVWQVGSLAQAMGLLRVAGAEVIALDVRDAGLLSAWVRPARGAVVLVAGAEETGIRPQVRDACTRAVRIEGTDAVESLNVGVALAIALARSLGRS